MTTAPSVRESLQTGIARGLDSIWILARVLIPVYVVVDLLKGSPVLDAVARAMQPLMGLFGLPGEAAMVLVAGYLINLYGAIGALVPLDLSPREITLLGLMLGIAHGLLLETAIIRQIGTRWAPLLVIRVGISLFAGAVVCRILP